MKELRGIGVSTGNAEGVLTFYKAVSGNIEKRFVENTDLEIARLKTAKQSARRELEQIYQKALKIMSAEYADIFKAHVLILESNEFSGAIEKTVKEQKLSAECAVETVAKRLSATLEHRGMTSPIDDIRDVSQCFLRNLKNEVFNHISASEDVILCADDLVPSQVLEFHKSNIAGFCLIGEKHSSHISIITRAMGIPAVVGLERPCDKCFGKKARLDGQSGVLTVDES